MRLRDRGGPRILTARPANVNRPRENATLLRDGETLADLRGRFPAEGMVRWIGVRGAPRGPLLPVPRARLLAGHGVEGDHRARRAGGRRQVTLVQCEHLEVVAGD